MKEAHTTTMRQFYDASLPLRRAVAKEWMSLTETAIKQNLVSGWKCEGGDMDDEPLRYRLIKHTNLTKLSGDTRVVKCGVDGELQFCYEYVQSIDEPGPWDFVPFMHGVPLDTQRAIIHAMTPPPSLAVFA